METIRIGERAIGPGQPVFVIAEAGINHNGSLDQALALVDAAADAGCDAVKFQKRDVRALLSRDAYERPYRNGGHSYGATYGAHREHLELAPEAHVTLRDRARARGIDYLASVWDGPSASFVDSLEVPAHKIGSPDLTNLPLCSQVAKFGKPLLLSTGMCEAAELEQVVDELRALNPQLVLLHCVSIYPTPPEALHLRQIPALIDCYDLPVGFSGHEQGWHCSLAAVALGACVVEKHLTLDRAQRGSDHAFSLEPDELARMLRELRELEAGLRGAGKMLHAAEQPFRQKLAKSLASRVPLPAGTRLSESLLTCKSPATGISPLQLDHVLGRRVRRDVAPDAILQWEDLEP